MLALAELRAEEAAEQASRGPHGHPIHETTQLLADANLRGYGWHYEARVRVDHAQRALNRAMKERREAYPEEDSDSLRWAVVRVEDGPHVLPPHLQPR